MNRQILHDPAEYANPMEFNPERFLGDHPERDPRGTVFGYGRRICECFVIVTSPCRSWSSTSWIRFGRRRGVEERWVGDWFRFRAPFSAYPFRFPRRTRMLTPFVCVVCWAGPGINLVQSSLWLTCAMSLAVFDAGKYADGFGNVVEPKICYSDGATRRVLPHLSPFSPIAAPVSTRLCPAA